MPESARWTRRSLIDTDQRKEDHDEFTAILAANTAAVDQPGFCKIVKLIDELSHTEEGAEG